MLEYEICRVHIESGKELYSTVAWTDNREYARQIKEALEVCEGKKYAVIKRKKEQDEDWFDRACKRFGCGF